ncbi:MAG TPA: phosphatase PAP2 family protein [Actinocrinis sp.]|nr:phosphatase PAP2 family protein [Actinocrinis sp.]
MRNLLSRIDGRLILVRIVLPACLLTALMVGIGFLITRALTHDWPFTAEDGVDRSLAAHRTGTWNDVSDVFSTGASTLWAIPLAIAAVVAARLVFHRWREAGFIAVAMLVEVSVFLLTTLLVHRSRPGVPELDVSPPTSSYPSGHSAAALALYGSVALVIYLHARRRTAWLLLLIPVAVAGSRLYRGMHHPSDVIAGLLLGFLAILIAKRAVLDTEQATRTARATAGRTGHRPRPRALGGAR